MARDGTKTGGRNWEPGQSGNPAGAKRLPEDLQAVRKLSPGVLKTLIDKLSIMNAEEIKATMATGACNMLEMAVASIWVKAIEQGDYNRLNFILDRSRIGKVKEVVEFNVAPRVIYKTTQTEDGRLLQDIIKDGIEIGNGPGTTDDASDVGNPTAPR